MTRTKREENNIVMHFCFYFIGVITLIVINLMYVYPNYKEIEEEKSLTNSIYNSKTRIETSGINLTEFKQNIPRTLLAENQFLANIVNSINNDFFEYVFSNKPKKIFDNELGVYVEDTSIIVYSTYNEYYEDLLKKYSDRSDLDKNISLVSGILPVYSEITNFGENIPDSLKEYIENNEIMSDFKFINYIESLAYTFGVNFNNSIGIERVVLLDQYSIGLGDNSLETNIYYIPLNLDISGTKESVIDFLYFIENVGKVKLDGEDLVLNTNLSSDFSSLRNKVLTGASRDSNYNILNNNIMDVHSVSLPNYIDSSFDFDQNLSFIGFLKTKQGRERINVRAEVRFYVKGFPSYIIESYINEFITKFNQVDEKLKQELSNSNNSQLKIERLRVINNTMTQLRTSLIVNLHRAVTTKVDLEKAYNEAYKYNLVLEQYLEQIKN